MRQDALRAASRDLHTLHGRANQPTASAVPQLLEAAGQLARAVRLADADQAILEVGAVADLLDGILIGATGGTVTLTDAVQARLDHDRARADLSGTVST